MTQDQVPKENKEQKGQVLKKNLSMSSAADNGQIGLYIGVALLFLIAIPFVYYSIIINNYAQKNQPEGF